MATVKINGQEVILLCNMGYDYDGKKIKPVQKKVNIPDDVIPEIWINQQAELFENEIKTRQIEPMPLGIFIMKHRNAIERTITNKDIERINQRLGNYDMKEITTNIVEDFHKQMEEIHMKFTAREHLHRVLCQTFKLAIELGYITANPTFRTFRYEKKQVGNVQTVDLKEIKKLVKCLETEHPKHKLFYSLVIATGLHRVKITTLKWSDVDFQTKTVKGIPVCKNVMEQLNIDPKNQGAIFTHNNVEMTPSSFTYRLNLIRKKHNLQNITMHKIQNTVCDMLETMDYLEMQRKAGL